MPLFDNFKGSVLASHFSVKLDFPLLKFSARSLLALFLILGQFQLLMALPLQLPLIFALLEIFPQVCWCLQLVADVSPILELLKLVSIPFC